MPKSRTSSARKEQDASGASHGRPDQGAFAVHSFAAEKEVVGTDAETERATKALRVCVHLGASELRRPVAPKGTSGLRRLGVISSRLLTASARLRTWDSRRLRIGQRAC